MKEDLPPSKQNHFCRSPVSIRLRAASNESKTTLHWIALIHGERLFVFIQLTFILYVEAATPEKKALGNKIFIEILCVE
jgi:hypothetical protein